MTLVHYLKYMLDLFYILFAGARGLLEQSFTKKLHYEVSRQDGKVFIITGCTSGIGLELARYFSVKGATIIMGCKNIVYAENLAKKISQETGNTKVEAIQLDLSSFASIRSFVEKFKAKNFSSLDVLINNAGVMFGRRSISADGFETHWATNQLGPFLLTNLLIDKLRESKGRVIFTSSIVHLYASIDFNDLQAEKYYSPYRAYAQSKLATVLTAYELNRRLKQRFCDVGVYCVHPGVVNTPLYRNTPFWIKLLLLPLKPLFKVLNNRNAKQGAQTSIFCAASEEAQSHSGGYFSECAEIPSSLLSYKRELQQKVWNLSAQQCGLVV